MLIIHFLIFLLVFLQEKLTTLTREKQSLEKRLQNTNAKLVQAQSDLTDEKELRKALQLNQTSWQTKNKQLQDELSEYKGTKETEVTDLREQVRDLMFFLEAQKQIENSSDKADIAGGQIIVPESSKNVKQTRRSHKKH